MKYCYQCRKEVPVELFGRNKNKYDGLQSWCKPCTSEYRKRYFKNPDNYAKKIRYSREYKRRPEVVEARREYTARYNKRPEVIEAKKEYNRRPDVIEAKKEYSMLESSKARKRQYNIDHKEKHNRDRRERYKQNKNGLRDRVMLADAVRRGATGEYIPSTLLNDLYAEQYRRCYYCTCPLCLDRAETYEEHQECEETSKPIATLEHLLPLSRGGKHEIGNLAWVCKSCNSKKGNKTVEEYVEWLMNSTEYRLT